MRYLWRGRSFNRIAKSLSTQAWLRSYRPNRCIALAPNRSLGLRERDELSRTLAAIIGLRTCPQCPTSVGRHRHRDVGEPRPRYVIAVAIGDRHVARIDGPVQGIVLIGRGDQRRIDGRSAPALARPRRVRGVTPTGLADSQPKRFKFVATSTL
jgi:hypothetical protein